MKFCNCAFPCPLSRELGFLASFAACRVSLAFFTRLTITSPKMETDTCTLYSSISTGATTLSLLTSKLIHQI